MKHYDSKHGHRGKKIHRISLGPRPDICMDCEMDVMQAVNRLLKVEKEVLKMDRQSREWFFGKEGHRDTFLVARAMKALLKAGV